MTDERPYRYIVGGPVTHRLREPIDSSPREAWFSFMSMVACGLIMLTPDPTYKTTLARDPGDTPICKRCSTGGRSMTDATNGAPCDAVIGCIQVCEVNGMGSIVNEGAAKAREQMTGIANELSEIIKAAAEVWAAWDERNLAHNETEFIAAKNREDNAMCKLGDLIQGDLT